MVSRPPAFPGQLKYLRIVIISTRHNLPVKMTEVDTQMVFSELEDLLGTMVRVKMYTQICYCYPLPDPSILPQMLEILNQGYARLCADIPWLAGRVTIRPARPGRGVGHFVGRTDVTPTVKVNDLTITEPKFTSFEELQAAGFPFRLLDSSLLTDPETKSLSFENNQATVLMIQLNLIPDGMILTISGDHTQLDGQGVAQVTQLFSKACRNIPLTPEEIYESNRARIDVIPIDDLKTYEPGLELSHYMVANRKVQAVAIGSDVSSRWAYIHFSRASLVKLKAHANETRSSETPYITTNDALSALLWQASCRARLNRLSGDAESIFCRAVDMRSYMNVSPMYLGNMLHQAYSPLPVSTVCSLPLGKIASILRTSLNPQDLTTGLRSLVTYIAAHQDDLSSVSFAADIDSSKDIWFSSWAGLPCYDFDFALGGLGVGLEKPDKVRVPLLHAFEGLFYLLPMDRDGGIDAAVCLREVELDGMSGDEELKRWGDWIG